MKLRKMNFLVCKGTGAITEDIEQIIIPFKNTGTRSLTTVSDIKSFATCIGNNYVQLYGHDKYLGYMTHLT